MLARPSRLGLGGLPAGSVLPKVSAVKALSSSVVRTSAVPLATVPKAAAVVSVTTPPVKLVPEAMPVPSVTSPVVSSAASAVDVRPSTTAPTSAPVVTLEPTRDIVEAIRAVDVVPSTVATLPPALVTRPFAPSSRPSTVTLPANVKVSPIGLGLKPPRRPAVAVSSEVTPITSAPIYSGGPASVDAGGGDGGGGGAVGGGDTEGTAVRDYGELDDVASDEAAAGMSTTAKVAIAGGALLGIGAFVLLVRGRR